MWIALLVFYGASSMDMLRVNVGVGIVCMVNSTALGLQGPHDDNGSSTNAQGCVIPPETQLEYDVRFLNTADLMN